MELRLTDYGIRCVGHEAEVSLYLLLEVYLFLVIKATQSQFQFESNLNY